MPDYSLGRAKVFSSVAINFGLKTIEYLSSYPTILTSHTEWRVNAMKVCYVLAWITAPGYYFTIVFYRKNRCKIGNNTIILNFLFAMGTKIVLKLSFEKLYNMIVTHVCAFVNA